MSGEGKECSDVNELNKKEKMEEYQERLKDEWNVLRDSEEGDMEEEWQLFKCHSEVYSEGLWYKKSGR